MARRLKTTVYVTDVEGRPKALLPGYEPTAEEAEGITNPDVWESEGPSADASGEPPKSKEPSRRGSGSRSQG